ncbi:MAG TPA: hypothetical protein VF060_17415, partial [Trebonia sp.]
MRLGLRLKPAEQVVSRHQQRYIDEIPWSLQTSIYPMDIGHETTVFEIFRTAFDQDKVPMRVTVTVFPADRNQFIVNVGDDLPDP